MVSKGIRLIKDSGKISSNVMVLAPMKNDRSYRTMMRVPKEITETERTDEETRDGVEEVVETGAPITSDGLITQPRVTKVKIESSTFSTMTSTKRGSKTRPSKVKSEKSVATSSSLRRKSTQKRGRSRSTTRKPLARNRSVSERKERTKQNESKQSLSFAEPPKLRSTTPSREKSAVRDQSAVDGAAAPKRDRSVVREASLSQRPITPKRGRSVANEHASHRPITPKRGRSSAVESMLERERSRGHSLERTERTTKPTAQRVEKSQMKRAVSTKTKGEHLQSTKKSSSVGNVAATFSVSTVSGASYSDESTVKATGTGARKVFFSKTKQSSTTDASHAELSRSSQSDHSSSATNEKVNARKDGQESNPSQPLPGVSPSSIEVQQKTTPKNSMGASTSTDKVSTDKPANSSETLLPFLARRKSVDINPRNMDVGSLSPVEEGFECIAIRTKEGFLTAGILTPKESYGKEGQDESSDTEASNRQGDTGTSVHQLSAKDYADFLMKQALEGLSTRIPTGLPGSLKCVPDDLELESKMLPSSVSLKEQAKSIIHPTAKDGKNKIMSAARDAAKYLRISELGKKILSAEKSLPSLMCEAIPQEKIKQNLKSYEICDNSIFTSEMSTKTPQSLSSYHSLASKSLGRCGAETSVIESANPVSLGPSSSATRSPPSTKDVVIINERSWRELVEATETLDKKFMDLAQEGSGLFLSQGAIKEVNDAFAKIRKHANRLNISEKDLIAAIREDADFSKKTGHASTDSLQSNRGLSKMGYSRDNWMDMLEVYFGNQTACTSNPVANAKDTRFLKA